MIELLGAQPTLALRFSCAPSDLPRRVPDAIGSVLAALGKARVEADGPPYTRYLAHHPEGGYFEVEVGVPVADPPAGIGDTTPSGLPGGPAILLWHEGAYASIGASFARLGALVRELGRAEASPSWESYVIGPADDPDPHRWKTALYQPVRPVAGDGGAVPEAERLP